MKEIIIGLAGKPKSGKSEVAKYLCSKYGIDNFVEMSDQIVIEVKKSCRSNWSEIRSLKERVILDC